MASIPDPNPSLSTPSTHNEAVTPTIPAPRHLPPRPLPTYLPVDLDSPSPLLGDRALYKRIAGAKKTLVSSQTVAIRSAEAFEVRAGQVFRLTTPAGPQVGDLNVWSAGNPRERFWASRTRQLHAAHLSTGHRLWSCLPYLRPLATITADSLGGGAWGAGPPLVTGPDDSASGGGSDGGPERGTAGVKRRRVEEKGAEGDGVAALPVHASPPPPSAPAHPSTSSSPSPPPSIYPLGGGIAGCHDLLGTRCDPYVNALLGGDGGGQSFDFQCHSNLTRAVLAWGLSERDVHDVLNVFQLTGLDARGRYWMGTSPARPGDFLEFFAETDLLCALSACPGGDLSRFGWTAGVGGSDGSKENGAEEEGKDPMLQTCRPLGIEVFDIDDRDEVLRGWTEPKRSGYSGIHGIRMPIFGE